MCCCVVACRAAAQDTGQAVGFWVCLDQQVSQFLDNVGLMKNLEFKFKKRREVKPGLVS